MGFFISFLSERFVIAQLQLRHLALVWERRPGATRIGSQFDERFTQRRRVLPTSSPSFEIELTSHATSATRSPTWRLPPS